MNDLRPSDPGLTIRHVVSTRIPTRWGTFRALGFERDVSDGHVETAFALVRGDVSGSAPLLRIHSQCLTGELLGSLRCDCGEQLEIAMRAIAAEGRGLVLYEHQEGRGIGLLRPGGVLERRGHTEAAVDLATLAGLYPAGVICEIVNEDGTMARVPDLEQFCRSHGLLILTVADLARYRLQAEGGGVALSPSGEGREPAVLA